jgi:hypothetical protein
VLKLATMWDMPDLRTYVIEALEVAFTLHSHLAASQICAGLDYGVDGWPTAGIEKLITRPDPMSTDDIVRLNPVLMALILKHREQALRYSVLTRAHTTRECSNHGAGLFFEVQCEECMRPMAGPSTFTPTAREQFNKEAGPIIQRLTRM